MHPFIKPQNILEEQIISKNQNKLVIDYSQLVIVTITGIFKTPEEQQNLTEFEFKSSILFNLKNIVKKFKTKYPEIIIAVDNTKLGSYKRDFAPYYKAHRAEKRKDSDLNWEFIFSQMKKLADELKENFSYKVIDISRLEADDIIGYIANKGNTSKEYQTLIVSSDGDFTQLHTKHTRQWSLMHEKFIEPKISPIGDLVVKIIKGDNKDAISGIKVPGNHSYNRHMGLQELNEIQRTPATKQAELDLYTSVKNLDELRKIIPEEYKERLEENIKLLDLSILPDEYKALIEEEYNKNKVNNQSNKSKIYSYLLQNKLMKLLDLVQDF